MICQILLVLQVSVALASTGCTVEVFPRTPEQPQPVADGIIQPAVPVSYQGDVAYLALPIIRNDTSPQNVSALSKNALSVSQLTALAVAPAPAPAPASTHSTAAFVPGITSTSSTGTTISPSTQGRSSGFISTASPVGGLTSTTSRPVSTTPTPSTASLTVQASPGAPLDVVAVLKVINMYRAINHAAPLAWSPDLVAYATNWTSACQFKHSFGPYGENLCLGFNTWPDCIAAWYAENLQYNFNVPAFTASTGHWSQLVWKATTLIGCASISCPALNGVFYSCNFAPQGNVAGQFYDNVLPP